MYTGKGEQTITKPWDKVSDNSKEYNEGEYLFEKYKTLKPEYQRTIKDLIEMYSKQGGEE